MHLSQGGRVSKIYSQSHATWCIVWHGKAYKGAKVSVSACACETGVACVMHDESWKTEQGNSHSENMSQRSQPRGRALQIYIG